MSAIEVIPTDIDNFDSLFEHLTQPSTMPLSGGTGETAVPLVSSTTTHPVSHYEQGRRIVFSGKSPQEKEVSSSSSTMTTELVEILPAGRFKYGPIVIKPRSKKAKTLLTGRRSKYEVLNGAEEERRHARRERNRLAATKCREKRENTFSQLEHSLAQEESRHSQLLRHVDDLKRKRDGLLSRMNLHNECCFTSTATVSILPPPPPSTLINSTYDEQPLPSDLQMFFQQQPEEVLIPIEMNSSSFERILSDIQASASSSSATALYNSAVPPPMKMSFETNVENYRSSFTR